MPDDTLTADELRATTGKAQPKSQAAALAEWLTQPASDAQTPRSDAG